MSFVGHARAGLHRLALAEMRLGVEQHRGGDDRRRLLHAEVKQRRVRRGLHVLLGEAAVVFRLVGRKLALAVPLLRQHGEMADRVHLRALRAGLAAHRVLAVEGVHGAGNADGRPVLVDQRRAERRLRHGVGADVRQLVGLRLGIGEMRRAALPGGGAERVGHAELVAGGPRRSRCRSGRLRVGETWKRKQRAGCEQRASECVAGHDVLPETMAF